MRLVVDTGIHAGGWSREEAIRYMLDTSSMAESDVAAEVERALGPRFDPRAFHRQVLVDGALPLGVLQVKIREWIAAEKARG
jgi:uncharacterized protein (DUF885 family)